MGLSRTALNKGDISTFQLLLEIAEGLSVLSSDPKALANAAKEAYALSDAEEAKATAAKSLIAQSDAAVAEAKKQQSIADEMTAEATKAKSSVDSLMDSIRKEQARLATVDAEQGKKFLEISEAKADLERRERELDAGIKKLAAERENLEKRAVQVVADEQALKEKVKQTTGLWNA
jgi:chromosome segregation ATPase